jgi:predicted phage terminase large subunit-like protein
VPLSASLDERMAFFFMKTDNQKIIEKLKKTDLTVYENLSDLFEMARITNDLDLNEEVMWLSAKEARKGKIEFAELHKKSLLFAAPHRLDAYLMYIEFDREPSKKFYLPRRKVLKVIVDDLQDLEDGKLDFLSISLPPRVGKSTLGCFFITWLMGKYPDKANVMSGHSDKLTDGFYREVLSILTDPQYLWSDVFPGRTIANTNAKNESIDIDKTRRFPTLTCRSIGGTLTGAVEVAKCLYCDDLIEDLEEALNPIRLQNKYDAYANQLKDRMKEGAYQLMIGTRWAVTDIQGRIEEQYRDNPRYRFRVIPALNDEGVSNFEYPYGLGFSTKYYMDMKDSIDDATWCAKYMGRPYEREGLLFPQDELNYYNGSLPDGKPDRIVAAIDVAWGGGDSLSMPIGYIYGDDCYVHDVVFNKGDKTVTRPAVVAKLKQHLPHMTRVEANNGGDEFCDKVDELLKADGFRLNLSHRKSPSTMSKLSRIIQVAPEIKRFYFRDFKHSDSEYRAFMRELTSFVVTGKNPHDDAPDSLAMLANLIYYGKNGVEIFKRPF